MSTGKEQEVATLLYDIDQLGQRLARCEDQLSVYLKQLAVLETAARNGTLDGLDEATGQFRVRVAPGINEDRALSYPTASEIWQTYSETTTLAKQITEKRAALALRRKNM